MDESKNVMDKAKQENKVVITYGEINAANIIRVNRNMKGMRNIIGP